MTQLGKLEKITDLREIWKHEQQDFSNWLAEEENLKALIDAVGIDIVQPERESAVGAFSVDLFAVEEGTGRNIVIENQLEETNHKHLGQIITYAAGKEAAAVIWIVKRARDEHRQAIEWLNQRTDTDVGFFLIEIEALRIGDSLPAVNFKIIEKPNNWTKTIRATKSCSTFDRDGKWDYVVGSIRKNVRKQLQAIPFTKENVDKLEEIVKSTKDDKDTRLRSDKYAALLKRLGELRLS